MTNKRTYILDTSVLLADPNALTKFEEHDIVLPVVVLQELEAKRSDPILGFAARTALRTLEQLRETNGQIDTAVVVNEQGGTVRVELNHQDQQVVPEALRGKTNDHRILTVACYLQSKGANVTLVSKDLPLRLFASLAKLESQTYRNEQVDDSWNGTVSLEVPGDIIEKLHDGDGGVPLEDVTLEKIPTNTNLILTHNSTSALAKVAPTGNVVLITGKTRMGRVKPTSAEQTFAIESLMDDSIPIVSLGGPAGTGKTFLTLAAGVELMSHQKQYDRIIVVRSLYSVGQQSLGYLPGNADEKMEPWALAVKDVLEELENPQRATQLMEEKRVDVIPVTYLRGRTLNNSFVIVDEAQQFEQSVLLTIMSRIGKNSKVVLTHDVAQRDNLHVGRHDGISAVVQKLKGQPEFAHVELHKTERSRVAEIVTKLLDPGT